MTISALYLAVISRCRLARLFTGAVLLGIAAYPAAGDDLGISPSNRGWFSDNNGFGQLAGQGQLGNFIVGADSNDESFHNFFYFDIPNIDGVVTAAELDLQEPPDGYASANSSETYEVHGVASAPSAFNTALANNPVLFNDIATGVVYGHAVVTKNDHVVKVPLSKAFVSQIESSQGQPLVLGGIITSLSSRPITQTLFAASENIAFSTLELTIQGPPHVTATAPSAIASTVALLHAAVNPNGLAATVTFKVDGIPVPGTVNVPAGTDDVTVSLMATGLSPDTDHQVTVTATTMNGTLARSDGPLTFHTAVQPPTPAPVVLGAGIAATAAVVPGAGTFPGLPAGAAFAKFDLPSIDATGAMAFRAILTGHPTLSVIIGPTAPGVAGPLAVTGGTYPGPALPGESQVVYAGFGDPALGGPSSGATGADAFGRTAFTATLKGAKVKPTSNVALLSTATADGSLGVLARTGTALLGHTLAAILSFAVDGDGHPCALVRYANGGGINASNNIAFVQWIGGAPSLIVAMKDTVTVNATPKTVASIAALQPGTGSSGAARGPVTRGGSIPACRVTFAGDGSQAIIRGSSTVEAYTGQQPLFGATGDAFQTFGLPAGGPIATFSAKLHIGGTVKAGENALFITPQNGLRIPIRSGNFAPGLGTTVKMTAFTDPVGGEGNGTACLATLQGTGVGMNNNKAVLWIDDGGFRRLAARTGDPAPGILSAKIASFASVALPPGDDNGPVFIGKLSGPGVNASNSTALWAAYPVNGGEFVVTDKLLRTGDAVSIGGTMQTITSIGVLQGTAGSLAQGRSYNGNGQVAVLVGYKNGGATQQALLTVAIP